MKLEKISPENYVLCEDNNGCYTINYGAVKRGTDMTVNLQFSEKLDITYVSIKASCGCTTPTAKQIDPKTIVIEIKYNSQLLGTISKTVTLEYSVGGQQKELIIKLDGVVTV